LRTRDQQVQPDLRIVRRGRMRMVSVAELEKGVDANAERALDGG
jgi:hypothetical protein